MTSHPENFPCRTFATLYSPPGSSSSKTDETSVDLPSKSAAADTSHEPGRISAVGPVPMSVPGFEMLFEARHSGLWFGVARDMSDAQAANRRALMGALRV